jgi:pseudaminic acid synthase
MTIKSNKKDFIVQGTIWENMNLYMLYKEAYTPWEWQPKLFQVAREIGIDIFSTAYDFSAVDFLEKIDTPAYKIASFEVNDLRLLRKIASTKKPILMSTGMATLSEIEEAVREIRNSGCRDLALLKCTSAYPAPAEEMNLRTIPHLSEKFDTPVGLSDHSVGIEIPIAGVTLGACIVEKHFTLSREQGGPDSSFSAEPQEMEAMVNAIRKVERALGEVSYELTESQKKTAFYRRSLYVVEDMKEGDSFSEKCVRSIRPAFGLPPKEYDNVIGRKAKVNIEKGTALKWNLVE